MNIEEHIKRLETERADLIARRRRHIRNSPGHHRLSCKLRNVEKDLAYYIRLASRKVQLARSAKVQAILQSTGG